MLWTFPYILLFYNILRDYIDIAPIPGDLFCLQIMIKHAVLNYFVHNLHTHLSLFSPTNNMAESKTTHLYH